MVGVRNARAILGVRGVGLRFPRTGTELGRGLFTSAAAPAGCSQISTFSKMTLATGVSRPKGQLGYEKDGG